MAGASNIEWTDATWNPIVGCSIKSPGCAHCYAMPMAARVEAMFAGTGGAPQYDGLTKKLNGKSVFTGKVAQASDEVLTQPLRWKRPRKIFVNSMGDLFHESIPDEWIDRVFAVMALSPQHTFQVLTKRADRMRAYFDRGNSAMGTPKRCMIVEEEMTVFTTGKYGAPCAVESWPLPNVWLGVSTERQQEADERIPLLLQTPAAVRFISAEPLLGPIDLTSINHRGVVGGHSALHDRGLGRIDWVIAGGESGHRARPAHPDWMRDMRDQCADARIPFFFKQWGEWAPGECADYPQTRTERIASYFNDSWSYEAISPAMSVEMHADDGPDVWRFGKSRAGRLLDGKEHNAFPEAKEVAFA